MLCTLANVYVEEDSEAFIFLSCVEGNRDFVNKIKSILSPFESTRCHSLSESYGCSGG